MKKKIFYMLFATLSLTSLGMYAQDKVQSTTALLGSWTGKLDLGMAKLTLVLNLEQADGYVKVTMDSPDQSAKGIPCKKEFLSDDSLAVAVEQLRLTYRGRLTDGQLVGTFKQNGLSLPDWTICAREKHSGKWASSATARAGSSVSCSPHRGRPTSSCRWRVRA